MSAEMFGIFGILFMPMFVITSERVFTFEGTRVGSVTLVLIVYINNFMTF